MGKHVMRKLNRRGDISSPIIVILVTVAALAVAGIAVAWMASVGARAANQGSLIVLGTPTVTTGTSNTLYITVRNIGNANVTIIGVQVRSDGNIVSNSSTIASNVIMPGTSQSFAITLVSANFTPGKTYSGILQTDAGTVSFMAYCP